ncbi:MAG: hypothetical protein V1773_15430 [bacterium]
MKKCKVVLSHESISFPILTVNNVKYQPEYDSDFNLPYKDVAILNSEDLPEGIIIIPFINKDEDSFQYKRHRISIENIGNNKARLEIEACIPKDIWPHNISIHLFQKIKTELIEQKKLVNPKITIFDEDRFSVHLHYTIDVPANNVKSLINAGDMFDENISNQILALTKNIYKDLRNIYSQNQNN